MVNVDIERIASEVNTPKLLLHSLGERSVAALEGRRLAAVMPNAEIVLHQDDNHIFLPQTPEFDQALAAIDTCIGKQTHHQVECAGQQRRN